MKLRMKLSKNARLKNTVNSKRRNLKHENKDANRCKLSYLTVSSPSKHLQRPQVALPLYSHPSRIATRIMAVLLASSLTAKLK